MKTRIEDQNSHVYAACLVYHGLPGVVPTDYTSVTLGNLHKVLKIEEHVYRRFLEAKKISPACNEWHLFPLLRAQEFMHLDQTPFHFLTSPEGINKVWVSTGISSVPALIALKSFILGCTMTHSLHFPASCIVFGTLSDAAQEFFTRIGLKFSMVEPKKELLSSTLKLHFPLVQAELIKEQAFLSHQ
ncbi:MAG: hypothetical protein WCG05_05485 [Alphaproteobacteria bacterium]